MIKQYTTLIATALFCAGMTTACSDDTFEGDPVKVRTATEVFFTDEETAFSTYYMPAVGRVGDPMPFYDKKAGEFKVLYLQEFDNNRSHRFHPIWGVSTKDACHYTSLGEVLPFGDNDNAQDAALGTGCCYYNEKDGLYYIYYTGHNGNCTNREVVMRATSTDCKTWTKDNLWALNGPEYGFSGNDFRDPQIFEEGGKYHMVISTYPKFGGDPKFVEFTSDNMRDWTFACDFKMIWDRMLECPDVFQMGDYWYLVYSESTRTDWSRKVKYMMAKSWEELKNCFNDGPKWPQDDREGVLDTRAFYAAKTATNGTDRYIWGWSPYRQGVNIHEKNLNVGADGEPNWSGALVCHKLVQLDNGTLCVGEVPAMAAKYSSQQSVNVVTSTGYNAGQLTGDAYVLYNRLGKHNHISFTVKTAGDGDRWGVSFARGTEKVKNAEGNEIEQEVSKYYSLIFNPEWENGRRKVNFEQQGTADDLKWFISGADGYIFPRPADNTYNIDIYTDNSVVTMYVDGRYGTTQRIYGLAGNCWSINSYGGNITVSDVKVSQY